MAYRSTDLARHVGASSADIARRVGSGTVDLARRVGPARGLVGLAIFAGALAGGVMLARYLRARNEELEHEQESMSASEAAFIDEGAGVRRRRRVGRNRRAASTAISH